MKQTRQYKSGASIEYAEKASRSNPLKTVAIHVNIRDAENYLLTEYTPEQAAHYGVDGLMGMALLSFLDKFDTKEEGN